MSLQSLTFAAGGARTMLAAFYGELAPRPRPSAHAAPSQDAYSLFYARSAAMGWLSPAAEGESGGVWGMNDAVAGPGSGPRPQRVAFFQVVLTGPDPSGVVPVQQFLTCAADVAARLGTLRLDAVQVLLPERPDPGSSGEATSPSGMRASRALLEARNWFADGDPRERVAVRVTLDGGPDRSVQIAAPEIARWVQGVRQDVFTVGPGRVSLADDDHADDDHLVLWPAPLDGEGAEFPHHRLTIRGTLAEWSPTALGWLAAFLAEGCSRHGVQSPLMITADRARRDGPV